MSVNYTISGGGTIMTFDDGVTEILQADVQTYAQYLDLTTIVIPTSVVTICGTTIDPPNYTSDGAFSNMLNLTTITINTPSSLEVIGLGAFLRDIRLMSITFPSGLQYIGDYAFYIFNNQARISNMNISTIPSSVTYLGTNAFASSGFGERITFTNLTTLPPGITEILDRVFYYTNFSITLTIPSTILDIGVNSFVSNFNGGTGTDCGLILSNGLKNIAQGAFFDAAFSGNLTLIIPPSTRSIGYAAFIGNTTPLTDITYTSTTVIDTDVFPIGANITILPGPDPPTDISGVRNPTTIYLYWTAPTQTGATPIAYYVITDTISSTVYQTPNSNTNYTVTGTNIDTTYTFTIQTVNQDEAISSVSTDITFFKEFPDPPTDISGIRYPTSIYLYWTAPTDTGTSPIANYIVTNITNDISYNTPNSNTYYTNTGTDPNTVYTYSIQTVNQGGFISTASTSLQVAAFPGPPTNLSASNVVNAILLSWTAPVNTGGIPLTNYIITDTINDISYNTLDTSTTYDVSGLTPNLTYTFVIQSVNSIGNSIDSSDVSGIPLFPIGPPTNVSATANILAILLNWTAPINTGGYPIDHYIITDVGADTSFNTPTADTSYNITSLTANITYTYFIQSANTNGDISVPSPDVSAIPLPPSLPSPPTDVAAIGQAESVYLSWTAPTNTGGFPITAYIVTDVGTDISTNTMSSATNYTVTGLTVGQSYTYVIQTLNSYGDLSVDSSSATAVARSIYPDPPTNLRLLNYYISVSLDDYIQIRFTPPVYTGNDPTITSYLVTDVSNGVSIAISLVTPPPFTFYGGANGLIPGTTYNFVMQAVNGNGNFSVDSSSVFTIYMTPQPDPPTYISFTPYVGYVVLDWGAPNYTGDGPVSYYAIELDYSPIYTTDASTSYTLVTNGGFVTVQTVNTLNAISTPVEISVFSYAPPNPPTNLTISDEYIGLYLEWIAPDTTYTAPIDYYRITDVSNGTTYQAYDVSYNFYPLRPGVTYTYNVRTVDTLGNVSDPTPDVSGIPITPPPPDPPSNLEASGIILGVYLSWTAPPDTGGGPAIYYIITNVTDSTTIDTSNADTSYNVTGLGAGFSYTFLVQTVDLNGDISPNFAGPVSATPIAPAFPDPPTDISAIPETLSIYLSWTAPINEGGGPPLTYIIRETDVNTSITNIFLTANTYYSDVSANNPAHSYTYTIQTEDRFGRDSLESAATPAISPYDLPSPPLNLTASGETLSVYLAWDVPTTIGQTAVAYYIITNITNDISFNTLNANTSYNVPDLSANVPFTFETQMVNTAGYVSGFSNTATGTPFEPPPPNPPTDVSAAARANAVALSWTQPPNTGGGPPAYYIITDVDSDISYNTLTAVSTYTVTGLTPTQTYTYHVQTVNTYYDPALNTSVPSADVSAIPGTNPDPPTDVSAINITSISALITWTPPIFTGYYPISQYIIFTTINNFFTIETAVPGTDVSYNLTGLFQGDTYYVVIRSVNTITAQSIDSSSVEFTPSTVFPPDPPTDLSAISLVEAIYVSWVPPINTGGAPIIYYSLYDPNQSIFIEPIYDTSYTITGLQPGGVYNIYVTCTNTAFFQSIPSSNILATPATPAITDLAATATLNINDEPIITLQWTHPIYNNPFNAYPISYYIITDISNNITYNAPDNYPFFNYFDISGVTPGVLYTYVIQSVIISGPDPSDNTAQAISPYSNDASAIAIGPPIPPDPPTDLSGYATSYNSIYLQWVPPVNTGSSPISFYTIYNQTAGVYYVTTDISYNVDYIIFFPRVYLQADTSYTFVVTATSYTDFDRRDSSDSSAVTITTFPSPPPGPPTNVVAQSYNQTSIQIDWVAPVVDGKNPIAGYIITNVTTGYSYPQTMGPEPTEEIITNEGDPGLTPLQQGVLYTFYIVTIDDRDISSVPSASVSASLTSGSQPPEYVAANSTFANSITLGWSPGATGAYGLSYYLITNITIGKTYRSYPPYVHPIGELIPNPYPNPPFSIPPIFNWPYYVISDLSYNVSYSFYIQTVNTYLQISSPSVIVSAVPIFGPYPPTDVSATGLLNSIYITWTASENDSPYNIENYRITDVNSGQTYDTAFFSGDTYYLITDLEPATTYTYYVQAKTYNEYSPPSLDASATTLPPSPPDPPTNLLSYGYVNSILLFWTPPSDISGYNAYFLIVNTEPPYDSYYTENAEVSSFDISNLDIDITRTYVIQTFDRFGQSSDFVEFAPATTIGKIEVTINISGDPDQTIITIGTPIVPWTVTSFTIPSPYDAPPYPNNPVTGTVFFVYTDSTGNILPGLPSDQGFYTVYAYMEDDDPYYTGTSATYTIFVKIALPQLLNCSPALELNALSKGGNFSSAITLALAKQMNNTTIAAKVFVQTSAPVCCSTSPPISPFSGGTTSGTHTNAIIQEQAVCTYNQNLAVAKLRQIPGQPMNNNQRFAKYQRFPSAEANCMPPVIVTGLPKALNGPCTNVIGISQTKPPS